MTRAPRISRATILNQLKLAARRGDRVALALATEQMKTWAYSPRYWEKYLQLLVHPLPRLVDLLLIKQGEKIARQKGWVKPKRAAAKPVAKRQPVAPPRAGRRTPRSVAVAQPSLFPDL